MTDPVLGNDNFKALLAQIDQEAAQAYIRRYISMTSGYAPPQEPTPSAGVPFMGEVGDAYQPPEASSFGDAFTAAYVSNAILPIKTFMARHDIFEYQRPLGTNDRDMPGLQFKRNVEPFNLDKFMKDHEGALSPSIRAAYIEGTFDHITDLEDMLNYAAYFMAEDKYKEDISNAKGVIGTVANLAGSFLAPESLLLAGGTAAVSTRVMSSMRAAAGARTAAQITAQTGVKGVQVLKTSSKAGAVAENILAGQLMNVPLEMLYRANDPTRTADETLINFASSAIFDGAFGGVLATFSNQPWLGKTLAFTKAEPKVDVGVVGEAKSRMKSEVDAIISQGPPPEVRSEIDIVRQYTEEMNAEVARIAAARAEAQKALELQRSVDDMVHAVRDDLTEEEILEMLNSDLGLQQAVTEAGSTEKLQDIYKRYKAEIAQSRTATGDTNSMDERISQAERELELYRSAHEMQEASGVEHTEQSRAEQKATEEEMQKTIDDLKAQRQGVEASKGDGGGGVPNEGQAPKGDDATPSANSYEDYRFFNVNGRILQAIENLGMNLLPFWRPASSLELTHSGPLSMLMHKIFISRVPVVGSLTGTIPTGLPFESVAVMIQAKQHDIDTIMAHAFHQVDRAGRKTASRFMPQETWGPEAQVKLSVWNDFLDRVRAAYHAENSRHVVQLIDDADQVSPSIESSVSGKDIVEKGIAYMGQAEVDLVLQRLGMAGQQDKLVEIAAELFDTVFSKIDNLRAGITKPTVATAMSYSHDFLQQHFSVRLLGDTDNPISLREFVTFWKTITERTDDLADIHAAAADVMSFFKSKHLNISEAQMAHAIANIDNTTDHATNNLVFMLRDHYMNHFGGFIRSFAHAPAMELRKADGSRLVWTDFSRSTQMMTRTAHMLELANTLYKYLDEAGQWDAALREAADSNHASEDVYMESGVNVSRKVGAKVKNRYHELRAVKGLLDANYNAALDAEGLTEVMFTIDFGFFAELRDWNNEVLNLLQRHALQTIAGDPKVRGLDGDKGKAIQKEREMIVNAINHMRYRTGLGSPSQSSFADEAVWSDNLQGIVRNIALVGRGANHIMDIVGTAYATAMSPFKGDFIAMLKGMAMDLSDAQRRNNNDMGAMLESMEFVLENNQNLIIRRYAETEYTQIVDSMHGRNNDVPIATASKGQKSAAMLSGPFGRSISFWSLGNFGQELSRSMAISASMAQVISKEGILAKMVRAFDDVQTGKHPNWQLAMRANGLDNWWGHWATQMLSEQDVRLVHAMMQADQFKMIKTSKRFWLDKVLGEYQYKVVDGGPDMSIEQRTALENIGNYVNFLSTKEKVAMPGWMDDVLGTNRPIMKLIYMWMRPPAAIFNRLFVGNREKGKMFTVGLGFALTGSAIALDWIKRYSAGQEHDLYQNIKDHPIEYMAQRMGWVGFFGINGEKLINTYAHMGGRKTGGSAFLPPVIGILDNLITTSKAIASPAEWSKGEADAVWRVSASMGIPANTLGAKMLGKLGRSVGIYNEDIDASPVRKYYYDILGVKEQIK